MNKKVRNIIENLAIFMGGLVIVCSIGSVFTPSNAASRDFGVGALLKGADIGSEGVITAEDTVTLVNPPKTQIALARTKLNEIEELDIETYIAGVVAAEMPSSFEFEALKAQAVAVRGLTFSRIGNPSKHSEYNNADVCDDHNCCQAYDPSKVNNTILQAVKETKGVTPLLAGNYAQTLYFASTLEGTLTDRDVWGNKTESTAMYKTLSGPSPESKIISKVANKYPYAAYTATISISSFIEAVNSVYPNSNLTSDNIKEKLKIVSKTIGGYVDKVQLGDVIISGSNLRYKLVKELKSANFTIEFSGSNILFTSKGYGHGVGMSQWGANALAKEGKDYREILNYYFNNLELEQLY